MGFEPAFNPWSEPDLSIKDRNLPHLETPAATYFVTFKCRRRGIILTPAARSLALAAVRFWDSTRIKLDAAVVMPDHLHALFRLLGGFPLGKLLHSVKSYSSHQINSLMKWSGPLWQDERFDHIVRDETSWKNKIEYIRQNPVRKNLAKIPSDYPWLYVRSGL